MEEILGKQPPQLFGIPLKKKSGLLIVWKILEPVYLFSLLMFSVACQQFFICMYFYYHTYATICPKYSLKVLLVVLQNLGSSNCYFQGGFSNLFNQNRIWGAYGAPCSCFGYAGCLNTRIVIKEQIVIVCSFKMFMAYLMVVSKQLAGLSKNRTDAGPGERI